jgi:hypothetical protein
MAIAQAEFLVVGPPPARQPQPVVAGMALYGKRVVLNVPDGYVPDQRAIADPTIGADGRLYVPVCSEQDWYAWMLNGTAPRVQQFPAYLVWVE